MGFAQEENDFPAEFHTLAAWRLCEGHIHVLFHLIIIRSGFLLLRTSLSPPPPGESLVSTASSISSGLLFLLIALVSSLRGKALLSSFVFVDVLEALLEPSCPNWAVVHEMDYLHVTVLYSMNLLHLNVLNGFTEHCSLSFCSCPFFFPEEPTQCLTDTWAGPTLSDRPQAIL